MKIKVLIEPSFPIISGVAGAVYAYKMNNSMAAETLPNPVRPREGK